MSNFIAEVKRNIPSDSPILPSVIIAQAILESAWGESELARNARNLFGIKGNYNGQSYTVKTKEYLNGKWTTVNAAFKKYPSYRESIIDHGSFFTSTPWRTQNYQAVLNATDYKTQARALQSSGYATDPSYANKLIGLIDTHNLSSYDGTGGNQVGYKIVNMFNPSMYHINAPHAMTPKFITIHETGNNASARNEVSYMNSNSNYTSYHVAIDDKEVVQAIPFNRNSWNAGDGAGQGNRASIAIEICYNKDGGFTGPISARMEQAIENATLYVAYVLDQYGWGVDKLRQHWHWSGKNCPQKIRQTGRWNWFKNRVQQHLNAIRKGSSSASKPQASTPAKPQGVSEKGWSFAGTFVSDETIVVRRGYKSSGAPRLHLNKPVSEGSYIQPGDKLNFDHIWFADGLWWGRMKYMDRQDNTYYFVPLGVRDPSVEFSNAKLWGELTSLSMKKGSKVLDWHKPDAIK